MAPETIEATKENAKNDFPFALAFAFHFFFSAFLAFSSSSEDVSASLSGSESLLAAAAESPILEWENLQSLPYLQDPLAKLVQAF